MLGLKQLVLVRFSDDLLVVPRDSAWFGYWNGNRLQSMNETQLYQVYMCFCSQVFDFLEGSLECAGVGS